MRMVQYKDKQRWNSQASLFVLQSRHLLGWFRGAGLGNVQLGVRRIRSNIMFLDNMFMIRKLLRTYLERKKHDKRAWNVSSKEQKSMVAG